MNSNRPAEITTRNDIARDMIAGFAAVTPALADGYARAAEAVDSGAANALLDRWIQASRRLDPKGR